MSEDGAPIVVELSVPAGVAGVAVGVAVAAVADSVVVVVVVIVSVVSVEAVSFFVQAPSATIAERTRSAWVSFKMCPLVKN